MNLKHGFHLEIDTKAVAADGSFTGYASTFGNVDMGGEVVQAGAFAKSLKQRPAEKVRMLLSHDTSSPIGVWTSLVEDVNGLKATGRLIIDSVKGGDVYRLLKAGALDGLSIGFKTIRDRIDRKGKIRFIEQADLYEISLVTFPMNPSATVSTVKSQDPDRAKALILAIQQINERFEK